MIRFVTILSIGIGLWAGTVVAAEMPLIRDGEELTLERCIEIVDGGIGVVGLLGQVIAVEN